MKISFNTIGTRNGDRDGFGYAGAQMLYALDALGYEVTTNDARADVGLAFSHPEHARFSQPYKVLYFPWESTGLQPGWAEAMDALDEIWTPSPWCAGVFRQYTTTPVYVYAHGLSADWQPVKRTGGHINFLHQGGEAVRKGAVETVTAFNKAFTAKDDVCLTLKTNSHVAQLPQVSGRVHVISADYTLEELVALYHQSHVYVYPSAGEGFGLTPLQAIGTGMPTICTTNWAPYDSLLDPALKLNGTLVDSRWQGLHPGQVYAIDQDELIDRMRFAYNNYEQVSEQAYELAGTVHDEFNWLEHTRTAFTGLEARL